MRFNQCPINQFFDNGGLSVESGYAQEETFRLAAEMRLMTLRSIFEDLDAEYERFELPCEENSDLHAIGNTLRFLELEAEVLKTTKMRTGDTLGNLILRVLEGLACHVSEKPCSEGYILLTILKKSRKFTLQCFGTISENHCLLQMLNVYGGLEEDTIIKAFQILIDIEHVRLKISDMAKSKVKEDHKVKLAQMVLGPFEILERIGLVAYRLRLPEELSGVHDTFHVSNLKKCLADASLHVPLDEIKVKEPIEIMDRKVKSLKRSRILLVKVFLDSKTTNQQHPTTLVVCEVTWGGPEDTMKSKYP
ncbi:hypothetical protein Tco_0937940 [Tanacetum coccineum]|uniref:Tf2-1-like SH3-like domain-containing protein n=1 Tax=Tanacetum coccineum TaxID=301880 RepID=A0ABQ5DFP8_9ASTR